MKTIRNTLTLTTVITASIAVQCFAQDSKPDKPSPVSEGGIGEMYAQMYNGMFDYLSKPETVAKLAKLQKAYYDALIAEGFSHDDAINIVCSTSLLSTSQR